MATANRARLTPVSARRFGIEIGVAMAGVGILFLLRGAHLRAGWLALTGGMMLLAIAAARPALLAPAARRWMAFATLISRFTTPIALTIVYLVVLTPAGWARRTFGRSPIARDPRATTYWVRRDARSPQARRESMERRF